MTYTAQKKVTHGDTETGREITVTSDLEYENPGLAEHWVKGGDIEYQHEPDKWVELGAKWLPILADVGIGSDNLRKKQRQPVTGEVWELDCGIDDGDENWRPAVWVNDPENGGLRAYYFDDVHSDVANYAARWPMKYAAPSLSAYYARKIVGVKIGHMHRSNNKAGRDRMIKKLIEACEYNKD